MSDEESLDWACTISTSDDEEPEPIHEYDAPPDIGLPTTDEPENKDVVVVGANEDDEIYTNTAYNKHIKIVPDDKRLTLPYLNEFEMTNIVSCRAASIEEHNDCFVDTIGLDDPISQAKRELMERKCPLLLRRYVGDKLVDNVIVEHYEDWDPNEMIFAVQYTNVML